MTFEEFSGKTVDDAIESGLSKLGIAKEKAEIEVIEQGGFLKKARVRMAVKEGEGDKALKFVEGLLAEMNVKSVLEVNETEEAYNINIVSVDSGTLIGHRGDVLDAIQYLASIVANEGNEGYKRITLDCEGYRAKRVATLEQLAKRMADKAVEKSAKIKLEPMNPFERRVIHAALANDERVTTESVGEEPFRQLQIVPKNYTRTFDESRERGGRRPYGRDDRRGGRDDRRGGRDSRGGRDNRDRRDDRPRGNGGGRSRSSSFSGFGSYGYLGKSETPDNSDKTEE